MNPYHLIAALAALNAVQFAMLFWLGRRLSVLSFALHLTQDNLRRTHANLVALAKRTGAITTLNEDPQP